MSANLSTQRAASAVRPEIQLLRALAVLAVVVNHVWPARLTGGYVGVDIFFVISGYLITAHLSRELERTGRVRLARFWARRARRLLPASLLVLLVSAVGTIALLPVSVWREVMREIGASALYVQNWALAREAQDYFASGQSPSPVTHYWSLSLEEQFYVVWPLLAVAGYAGGKLLGRPRVGLGLVFGLVVVSSLAYSVLITADRPEAAYYVTPARMWQLGLGGLLALAPFTRDSDAMAFPRHLDAGRHVIALVGWGALVGSLVVFDEGAPVPGWIALLPALGAIGVIAAGDAFLKSVPGLLRPLLAAGLWIGAISYSLYLWHWPLVVLTPEVIGQELTTFTRWVLLGSMLVIAGLSKTYVEDPARTWPWLATGPARRTFLPALVTMVTVLALAIAATITAEHQLRRAGTDLAATIDDRCFGAHAIANRCAEPHRLADPDAPILRAGEDPSDQPEWGERCSQAWDRGELATCEFGVPAARSRLRVALVGDSHAQQWTGALDQIANERGWTVVMMSKTSCPASADPPATRGKPEYHQSCRSWNDNLNEEILNDSRIDVVFVAAKTRIYVGDGGTREEELQGISQDYQTRWEEWTASGKTVVAIHDVPRLFVGDVPDCVETGRTSYDPCTTPASDALPPDPVQMATAGTMDPKIVPVDLTRYFCGDTTCHAVIGGVVAYGDSNHLTGYFARSLAPYLYEQIEGFLPTG